MTLLTKWQCAIVHSNLHSSTRHVLLTMSVFMDSKGRDSTQKISDIVLTTGLSRSSVINHIGLAEKSGWIVKAPKKGTKNRVVYTAQTPCDALALPHTANQNNGNNQVSQSSEPKPPEDAVVHKKTAKGFVWGTRADLVVAQYMVDSVRRLDSKFKTPDMAKWANESRLMRTVEGRSPEEICLVFQWANQDRFWRSNILSPQKLRQHFTALSAAKAADIPVGQSRKTARNPTGVVL